MKEGSNAKVEGRLKAGEACRKASPRTECSADSWNCNLCTPQNSAFSLQNGDV